MIQFDYPASDQLFFDALGKLADGDIVIPDPDWEKPGDVDSSPGPPTDSPPWAQTNAKGDMWPYVVCPSGYQPFHNKIPCDTDVNGCTASSWSKCRPKGIPSTNGLPYKPPGTIVGKGFWQAAVSHAAASWYQHDGSNVNDAWTNPIVLQPWLDLANAWFWGMTPYRLGTGLFTDLLGGGSTADKLPWNQIPWGAIPAAAWTFLSAQDHYGSPIDWAAVTLHIAALPDDVRVATLMANQNSFDVSWKKSVNPATGLAEAPAAWQKNAVAAMVNGAWNLTSWTEIPWMDIPWGSLDWAKIANTEDLKAALTAGSPTTILSPCEIECVTAYTAANAAGDIFAQANLLSCQSKCPMPGPPVFLPPPGGFQEVGPGLVQVHLDVNVVECHPDELLIKGACVKPDPPDPTCDSSEVLFGGACVKPDQDSSGCKADEVKIQGACVKPEVPCLSGEIRVKGACVKADHPTVERCPDGKFPLVDANGHVHPCVDDTSGKDAGMSTGAKVMTAVAVAGLGWLAWTSATKGKFRKPGRR